MVRHPSLSRHHQAQEKAVGHCIGIELVVNEQLTFTAFTQINFFHVHESVT